MQPRLSVSRIAFYGTSLCAALVASATVQADDPFQPTSNWGTMPNGWAGYSLSQIGGFHNPQQQHASNSIPGHQHNGHQDHGHHSNGRFPYYGRYGFPGFPRQYGLANGSPFYGLNGGYGGYGYSTYPYPYSYGYLNQGISLTIVAPQWNVSAPLVPAAPLANLPALNPPIAPLLPARNPALIKRVERGPIIPAENILDPAEEIRRRVGELRLSTPTSRDRADRTLAQADRYFADSEYGRASARYRQALVQAPDYSKTLFRLGHAYVATHDYELALNYFLMALEVEGSSVRKGFSLEDMYRGNKLTKESHLEDLSEAALRQPEDGGLVMLVGLMLHYDGQAARAQEFFRRASEMPGAHQPYTQLLLKKEAEPARFEG